ncbi:MAG: hypothetical protein JXX14_24240 [Deltaproteobacteria bacterium]|nr:hypothetical protein [Deltaproteobacteria bacterium]
MKFLVLLLVAAAMLQTGCEDECDPGATQECLCTAGQSGVQTCSQDGSTWEQCHCSTENYTDSDSDSDSYADSDSDTDGDADDNILDELIDFFPSCKSNYKNDCSYDEVKIPCTDLCMRKTPIVGVSGLKEITEICASFH